MMLKKLMTTSMLAALLATSANADENANLVINGDQ